MMCLAVTPNKYIGIVSFHLDLLKIDTLALNRTQVYLERIIMKADGLVLLRFEHFGPMVKCYCGATNCQGFLGSKRKTDKVTSCWGSKRRRTVLVKASSK